MAQDKSERLTLSEMLKDLGFFYTLFAFLVGAPSWLSILQMVFVEYRLVDALQWILDGYNEILATLGAVIEPPLLPLIRWINAQWTLDLTLAPHWRPVFVLLMIALGGLARIALRDRSVGGLVFAIVVTLFALTVALATGFVPVALGVIRWLLLALAIAWIAISAVGLVVGWTRLQTPDLSEAARHGTREVTRMCLTILGGIFTAGLILAADAALKVLGSA